MADYEYRLVTVDTEAITDYMHSEGAGWAIVSHALTGDRTVSLLLRRDLPDPVEPSVYETRGIRVL